MLQAIPTPRGSWDFSAIVDRAGFMSEEEMLRKGVKNPKDKMLIWTVSSTGDRDEHKEEIDQLRLDKSYMTKDGKYTWGHKPPDGPHEPENILGIITLAELRKGCLYNEGELAKGKKKAITIYNDIKNNPDMPLYKASIEGSYKLFRDSNGHLRKSAIVRNVAFDTNVVNTNTLVGVLKSLDNGIPHCQCHKSIPLCETNEEKMRLYIYHNAICRNLPVNKIKALASQYFHLRKR